MAAAMSVQRCETVLLYFIVTWMLASSDVYKSVMWTTNNPTFQHSNTSILKSSCFGGIPSMKVHLQSILPIVCPFEFIIMQTMPSQPSTRVLYENIWIVYDEESFDTCNINLTARFGTPDDIAAGKGLRNKKLYDCSTPETLKRYMYSIDFKEKSPVSPGIYFEAGKTYYFLATSDGTYDSLNNTKDGHCNNDGNNEIRMKFQVYVCKNDDPFCENTTIGEFTCLRPPSPSVPTSSSVLSSISPTSSSSTTSESSVCVCPTSSMSTLPSSSSVAAELITTTITTTTTTTPTTTTTATTTSAATPTTSATSTATENPTTELCVCSGSPNNSKRTGSDAELLKSRDIWRIFAIVFVIAFFFVLIVLVIACYRLRQASLMCIFNDINKIESTTTPVSEKSPPYRKGNDKNGLIPFVYTNTACETDGPKTPQSSPDEGVEMTPVSEKCTVIPAGKVEHKDKTALVPALTSPNDTQSNGSNTNSFKNKKHGTQQPECNSGNRNGELGGEKRKDLSNTGIKNKTNDHHNKRHEAKGRLPPLKMLEDRHKEVEFQDIHL